MSSLLSRQLDRNYIYPYCLNPENMPRMHLGPHVEGNKDLDEFTERLLQARLANFWKSARVDCNNGHDLVGAEERYERFCNEYLANLPSAFALKPNMQWDTQFPILGTTCVDKRLSNTSSRNYSTNVRSRGTPGQRIS